mgnify:CR=1 FL=1
MNATEAKALLLPIPKAEFLTGRFTDYTGKCCAIGHLVRLKSDDPSDYDRNLMDGIFWGENSSKENCEVEIFARETVREFNGKKHDQYEDLAAVNNRTEVNGYTQDNPKDRVIALLNDMIADGL